MTVGNLGQNQNNVLKNILLMLITKHEERKVLQ